MREANPAVRGGTAACGASAPQDGCCPAITIIVPAYNAERWLQGCVDSIQAQTMEDFECILVDDGSADGTPALCDRIAQADKRFRAVHIPNSGPAAARNAALRIARGRWIACADSDDWLVPQELEYALRAQKEVPEAFVVWNSTRSPEEAQRRQTDPYQMQLLPRSQMEIMHYTGNGTTLFVHVWNKLFDGDLIRNKGIWFNEQLGRANTSGGEDVDFVRRYMACLPEDPLIAYLPMPLYCHTLNTTDSIIRTVVERNAKAGSLLDEAQPGYLPHILAELGEKAARVPGLWEMTAEQVFPFMQHYMRAVCFGLWCARQLHEPLPKGFWKDERLQKLLGWCAANRIHIAYWLPLRLRWRRLAEQMYVWSQLHDANFGHFDWLFYYIEGAKTWKRPDTL